MYECPSFFAPSNTGGEVSESLENGVDALACVAVKQCASARPMESSSTVSDRRLERIVVTDAGMYFYHLIKDEVAAGGREMLAIVELQYCPDVEPLGREQLEGGLPVAVGRDEFLPLLVRVRARG
jgi:hypothetical protein